MDELIERLNDAWRKLYGDGDEHDVCDTLAEAADALEAAREDAERYRWLRGNCVVRAEDTDEPQLVHRDGGLGRTDWRERLDAAIDQARGKEDGND